MSSQAPPGTSPGNNSCPPVLYPERAVCSGSPLGCINENFCLCDGTSWTGHGDLLFGSPTCGISVLAIQILHGILGTVALVALAVSFRYIQTLYRLRESKGKKFSALGVMSGLGAILGALCFCVLGWYRVAYPSSAIGTDVTATVLMILASCGFTALAISFHCSLFVLGFAHAGILQERVDRGLTVRIKWFVCIHLFFTNLCHASILCMLIQTRLAFEVLLPLFLGTHAALTLFMSTLFLTVTPAAAKKIRQRAGDRAKEGALKEILLQIDALTKSARGSCLFIVTVSVLFAVWEGLRNVAYPYVFVLIWILGEIWQIQVMFTLQKVSGYAKETLNAGRPVAQLPAGVVAGTADTRTPLQIQMQQTTMPPNQSTSVVTHSTVVVSSSGTRPSSSVTRPSSSSRVPDSSSPSAFDSYAIQVE